MPLIILLTIATLVVFGLIVWFYVVPISGNKLVVEDQEFTENIRIKEASVTTVPSLLVIQLEGSYRNPGAVLAETAVIVPDTYSDLELFTTPFSEELIDKLEKGAVAYVTLYTDNNKSRAFERLEDSPVRDIFGNPVRVIFRLKKG